MRKALISIDLDNVICCKYEGKDFMRLKYLLNMRTGKPVINEAVLEDKVRVWFFSYGEPVAKVEYFDGGEIIYLVTNVFSRSKTTTSYLVRFLKMYTSLLDLIGPVIIEKKEDREKILSEYYKEVRREIDKGLEDGVVILKDEL